VSTLHPLTRRALTRTASGWAVAGTSVIAAACGTADSKPLSKELAPATVEYWLQANALFEGVFAQELIPRFKAEVPQVTVNMVPVPGSWELQYDKLLASHAAGTPPDLDRGREYWTGDLAGLGVIEPLDPWFKRQSEVTPDQFHPAVWDMTQYRGRAYGVPLHYFARHLFYNETLLRQAGAVRGDAVAPPQTWDEYAALAVKITNREAGIYGTQLLNYQRTEENASHFQQFLTSAGGAYVNKDRSKLTFNTPQGAEALQFLVDLLHRHGAARPADVTAPTNTGKIGMWFAESGGIQRTAQSAPDLRYRIALMPKGKNRGVTLRGSILQILSGSKQKEAAFRFALFVSRDANCLLYTKTVSYPPTKKANEDKEPYVSNPMWRTAIEQARIKETIFQPSFPGYVEGSLRLAEEIVAAYEGKKSVKDALYAGERAAQEVLRVPK
jgi:multiple sugar transport system substrate-binding protein